MEENRMNKMKRVKKEETCKCENEKTDGACMHCWRARAINQQRGYDWLRRWVLIMVIVLGIQILVNFLIYAEILP